MGRPVDQLTPKGAATRREILRAAARVFDAKGYALARMDDVVSETGLTKGAVYFHFKSKAALAHAVVDDQKQGMLAHVRRQLEGLGGLTAQVRGLVPVLVDLVIAEPAGWSVVRLDRELTTESPQEHAQVSVLAEWVGLVEELLLAGRPRGRPALLGRRPRTGDRIRRCVRRTEGRPRGHGACQSRRAAPCGGRSR